MPPKRKSRATKRTEPVEESIVDEQVEESPQDIQEDQETQPSNKRRRSSKEDDNESQAEPTATSSKMEERMAKLQQLKRRRATEVEQGNRRDRNLEFQRSKENPRLEAKMERKRDEALRLKEKQDAEDAGEDFERKQFWKYSAESVANWEAKMAKKKGMANEGFTDHTQAAHKKYTKLVAGLKPDMNSYNEKKLEAMERAIRNGEDPEDLRAMANDLTYASASDRPSEEAIDRLVKDVSEQIGKRETRSRERKNVRYDDISWINEKNRVFNQKISRFYDKYTKEIRDSLERGTAL
ncbi:SYF2 splicing factor-domain-containing protein [Gongronella butleri]|nr:SYF2 splicing factor-domain-containing protein [Gongronella butleri]